MSAGIWFWIIYVMCILFGLWSDWPNDNNFRPLGSRFVIFILVGLLGWRVFGAPLQ